jgi:hypothetical protein
VSVVGLLGIRFRRKGVVVVRNGQHLGLESCREQPCIQCSHLLAMRTAQGAPVTVYCSLREGT